jgi:hypothetical protein
MIEKCKRRILKMMVSASDVKKKKKEPALGSKN